MPKKRDQNSSGLSLCHTLINEVPGTTSVSRPSANSGGNYNRVRKAIFVDSPGATTSLRCLEDLFSLLELLQLSLFGFELLFFFGDFRLEFLGLIHHNLDGRFLFPWFSRIGLAWGAGLRFVRFRWYGHMHSPFLVGLFVLLVVLVADS